MARLIALLLAAASLSCEAAAESKRSLELGPDATYGISDFAADFPYARDWKSMTADQLSMRSALLAESVAQIIAHNANGTDSSWRAGVNLFADRTRAERRSMRGYAGRGAPHTEARAPPEPATASLPASVDWRNEGVVTPVRVETTWSIPLHFRTRRDDSSRSPHDVAANGR